VLAYVEGIIRGRGVEVVDGSEAILFRMSKTGDRKSVAQAHLNPSKPSAGRFSSYDAQEIFLSSRRSTMVDILREGQDTERKKLIGDSL
jgi:hypothetical protein